jgi:hypothetical protein
MLNVLWVVWNFPDEVSIRGIDRIFAIKQTTYASTSWLGLMRSFFRKYLCKSSETVFISKLRTRGMKGSRSY